MSLDFSDELALRAGTGDYVAAYRYGGQSYQVMVNGRTGAIAGQRGCRLDQSLAGCGRDGCARAAVGPVGCPGGGAGDCDATVSCGRWRGSAGSLVLVIIGGVFAVMTLNKARGMDVSENDDLSRVRALEAIGVVCEQCDWRYFAPGDGTGCEPLVRVPSLR